ADGAKYKAGAEVKVAEAPDASQITTNAEGKKGTWRFAGWKDAAGKEVSGTIAMPAGGLTLTGAWIFTEQQESSEPSSSDKPVIPEESGMGGHPVIPATPHEKPPQEQAPSPTTVATVRENSERKQTVRESAQKAKADTAPKTGVEAPIPQGILLIAATGVLTILQRRRVRNGRSGRQHSE
ncbi:SHIRT domain-containing protein, partial [Peptoniphilaceae bacterium SGI.097]